MASSDFKIPYQRTGFVPFAESLNGRLAMLGFVIAHRHRGTERQGHPRPAGSGLMNLIIPALLITAWLVTALAGRSANA